MTDLTNKLVSNTYKQLILVSSAVSNTGVDTSLKPVQTGDGTNTALQVAVSAIKVTGDAAVSGNVSVRGNLHADDRVCASAFYGDGSNITGVTATIAGNISVSNAVVGGNLQVSGTTTVVGATHLKAAVSVGGAAQFGSTVTVSGAAQFNSTVTAVGAATFKSTVTVENALAAKNNVTVGGTFNVAGAGTFTSKTEFKNDVSVSGRLDVATSASVGGTFRATGNAGFSGAVSVSGGLVVGDTVTILGTNLQAASARVCASAYYGDGSNLTNLPGGEISGNISVNGIIAGGDVSIAGNLTAVGTQVKFENAGVCASAYYGDGSNLTGITAELITDGRVGGSLAVSAALSVGSTLNVGGATSIGGNATFGTLTSGLTSTVVINQEGGSEQGLKVKSRTNRATILVSDNDSNAYVIAEDGYSIYGSGSSLAAAQLKISNSTGDATFSGNINFSATTTNVSPTTSDASDNARIFINGGGAASPSRGSFVGVYGNENAETGRLLLSAGNVSGGDIEFHTGNSVERMRIDNAGAVTFTSDDTSDQFVITNADASSTSAPDLVLYRNSASPASSDNVGLIQFRGEDSAGNTFNYASILGQIDTPTDGAEIGRLVFYTGSGGSEVQTLTLDGGNVGIGTTDIIANSNYRNIRIGSAGNIQAYQPTDNGNIFISENAAINSAGNWEYLRSDFATYYRQGDGTHTWATAASGTDGNTVTFVERMRVTQAGLVGIGTSSPARDLHLYNSSGVADALIQGNSNDSILYFGDSTQAIFHDYSADELVLWTGSNALAIDCSTKAATFSGNVETKYSTAGGSTGSGMFVTNSNDALNDYANIIFGVSSGANTSYRKGGIFFQAKDANRNGDMVFALANAANSTNVTASNAVLTLSQSGNATFTGPIGVNGATPNSAIPVTVPNQDYIAWYDSGTSGGTTAYIRGDGGQLRFGGSSYSFDNAVATTFAGGIDVSSGTIKLDGNYPVGTQNVALGDTALDSVASDGNYNVAIGGAALTANTTGDNNTAVGYNSLAANTTGADNVAMGFAALDANTTANYNTAIGSLAMSSNIGGYNNTAVGRQALFSNTSGAVNVAVGVNALYSHTTGLSNVAIGEAALYATTTASNNTAVGRQALQANSTGANNTSFGYQSGYSNTTASNNTLIGFAAGYNNVAGANTAVGHQALNQNTTATGNLAVGYQAGYSNQTGASVTYLGYQAGYTATGNNNTHVGYRAGYLVTTGTDNTLVGTVAGDALTTGAQNTVVGQGALGGETTGTANVAIGYRAMQATSGSDNSVAVGRDTLYNATSDGLVAIGYNALNQNTSGTTNVAVGYQALDANTTGSGNTGVGYQVLSALTTGDRNVGIGEGALFDNTTGYRNVAIGYGAADNITTAHNNTAIGYLALRTNTTGNYNVALGSEALISSTTASHNTAVGYQSLNANTTGTRNTALGAFASDSTTTGNDNTALGYAALDANVTGNQNVAIGVRALQDNTTSNNVAVGYHAMLDTTTGQYNVAIGTQALDANTTGQQNTAIGESALGANTTGNDNVAVGAYTLDANTTGTRNTGVGYGVLSTATTANDNTGVGYLSMLYTTTGTNNTALGKETLKANTTGGYNTAVGNTALTANTTADNNTALGHAALAVNTTGANNTAIGVGALDANTTASTNTAVGVNALTSNTTGQVNTALGYRAMATQTTGSNNTALGNNALESSTTGAQNTAVGASALEQVTTAANNTAVGQEAGEEVTTGANNTFLGRKSGELVTTGSKNTVIGCYDGNTGGLDIRTSSNYIVLSDGDGNPRVIVDNSGNVGIGTTPVSSSRFSVDEDSGNIYAQQLINSNATNPFGLNIDFNAGSPDNNTEQFLACRDSTTARCIIYSDGDLANHDGTYGTISDRHYKTDIQDARSYWNDWKDIQFHTFTKGGKKQFGVIADELETVFPSLVHTSPDENHPDGESQWVDTMNLLQIAGKVIQELQEKNEALEARITALENA